MTFEEAYPIISELVSKRRKSWQLNFLSHVEFEDIKMEILMHIYNKWHLYDQTKPLGPWVSRISTNQIRNKVRNYYLRIARPCVDCAFNEGAELCRITPSGRQCSECKWFKDWSLGKARAYQIAYPTSFSKFEGNTPPVEAPAEVDYQSFLRELSDKIKREMNKNAHRLFELMYIDGLSEEDAAVVLGYKINNGSYKSSSAQRQIFYYKEIFKKIAKELVNEKVVGEKRFYTPRDRISDEKCMY